MHFANAVKALLTLTFAGAATAEQGAEHSANDLSRSLPISFGKCYHIVSDKKYLGHDGTAVQYLKFGGRDVSGIFKACAGTEVCTRNQPNNVVQAGEEFYLFDPHGNTHTRGDFIASDKGGLFYPSFTGYRNYVHFSGQRECFGENDCSIRVSVRDTLPSEYHGWYHDPNQYVYSKDDRGALLLSFEEVNCPESV